MKNNIPTTVYTRESLQLEQRRLKIIIKDQEAQLRQRVQKLPGELLYSGVDAILPVALTGRISDKILSAGRNLVNRSVLKKTNGSTSRLVAAAKQAGIFTIIKLAYNMFIRKKR